MPLTIAALNSGSNGNCYYVGTAREALLIDAGLSASETERRLQKLGIAPETIQGIFISHEHHDHVTGLSALTRKWQCPAYLTRGTWKQLPVPLPEERCRFIATNSCIPLKTLQVTAFPKSHDAAEPVSFVVSGGHAHVGIFTDIGYCCKQLIHYFRQCHAVILESNYCPRLLDDGNYPEALKKRIRGRKGHLSNEQALELFNRHRRRDLSHLLLGHLSQNNNTMDTVRNLFQPYAGATQVMVASRYQTTELLTVPGSNTAERLKAYAAEDSLPGQLKLF